MSMKYAGGRLRRTAWIAVCGSCLGALGIGVSCMPAAPPSETSPPVAPTAAAVRTEVAPTISAARTEVAPTVSAARTDVAPTVSAARTEVAPTVAAAGTTTGDAVATRQTEATSVTVARQATATVLAPTAVAVATRVAPTVQASATQVVSAVGTSVATSTMRVANVTVSPSDTMIEIQNLGSSSVNLAGWTLLLGPELSLMLGDINVGAGQTRTLHLSQGTDTPSDVYIGVGANVARPNLQPGARVILIAPRDEIASIYSIS
jgi:hypothetical protein